MLEYRKFLSTVGLGAPTGSTHDAFLSTDFLVWSGEEGTFQDQLYESYIMTLQEVCQFYGEKLKRSTYGYIDQYMPEWRLNRWRRYYDLRLKVLDSITLNPVEQAEYNCFPDPVESHEDCDVYVGPVLQWTIDCLIEHNRVFFGMYLCQTNEEILSLYNTLSYPPFLM